MNFVDALALVFAIYAFITALLLFVAQTENNNRVSHYWIRKGNRAWIVFFNSSRRHLLSRAFFEPLSFSSKGLTFKGKVQPIGKVGKRVEPQLTEEGGKYVLSFDYLAPKAALIAEFDVDGDVKRPEIDGVLKGGRLVKCYFQFDDILHHTPILLFGYGAFCALVILALRHLLNQEHITPDAFWVYVIAPVVLAGGVYWFFTRNRRIFVDSYMKVRKRMWGKG